MCSELLFGFCSLQVLEATWSTLEVEGVHSGQDTLCLLVGDLEYTVDKTLWEGAVGLSIPYAPYPVKVQLIGKNIVAIEIKK